MTFPRNLSSAALPALLFCATPAWAADNLFGTESPLLKFVDFITGPFAYAVVIIALVVTVGVLAIGGEFSGFSRRMPIIVIAGGIVILAGQVLENLFGGERAADLPPAILTSPVIWSESAPSEPTPSNPTLPDPALSESSGATGVTGATRVSGATGPQPDTFLPTQTIGEDPQ